MRFCKRKPETVQLPLVSPRKYQTLRESRYDQQLLYLDFGFFRASYSLRTRCPARRIRSEAATVGAIELRDRTIILSLARMFNCFQIQYTRDLVRSYPIIPNIATNTTYVSTTQSCGLMKRESKLRNNTKSATRDA